MVMVANPPKSLYFIRQSLVVLIIRLIIVEIIFASLYLFFRIPKLFLAEYISVELFVDLSIYSVLFFGLISFTQLLAVVFITLQWAYNYYFIRRKDILHRQGIFNLREETFSLQNIESFTVLQSAIGKIFNYGTIKFYSPILKQEYYLENIPDPLSIKNTIEKLKISKQKKSESTDELIIPIKNE